MNLFMVLKAAQLKRFLIFTVAAAFAVGVFFVEKEEESIFADAVPTFSSDEPSAIYSVPTDKKKVALTFDISWGDKRPGPILDVLKDKQVEKATFFLSSPWAENHPEIVQRIVDAGYEIGSHGHKHVNYSRLSDEEIRQQIAKADQILRELTGVKPNLIRMPNGDFDKRVLRVADSLGYTVIQWDTDSLDWMNPGVDRIIQRVLDKVHPGDIILMHASDSCKQTHEALPVIIDRLREQGYELVTVSELIATAQIDTTELP
ncbi:MAG: polysaccharide deacetylase family sporulation protein PdaB [Bacillus thermozeamaize]|uniref:Polysaccharide deacetylase family sporulation protein PdaB n=1 Tax=Bacillus thermozeamaize TaxID=230954 RepID=A0A1Y3PKR4_9BACI|nr:MAG: polysaccharide deacetylase family sporulation protein PdaB [Bacillus thermozeamaize]